MTLTPVQDSYNFHSGSSFAVKLSFTNWLASNSDLLYALNQRPEFSFDSIDLSTFGSEAVIYGHVLSPYSDVASNIRYWVQSAMANVTGIYGVNIYEIDSTSTSFSDIISLPTTTTIGLASLAIIAIVIILILRMIL